MAVIGLFAPARAIDQALVHATTETLEAWGHSVLLAPHLLEKHGIFAGTDTQRAKGLEEIIATSEFVLCMRGGYGSIRIIPYLKNISVEHRPTIIGFSDATMLLCFALQQGMHAIHGPMPIQWSNASQKSLQVLRDILDGASPRLSWKSTIDQDLSISGIAFGGNLAVLFSIWSTPWVPQLSGYILFFEEISEYRYAIDRMIMGMYYSGKLDGLKGIVIGHFTDINDNPDPFLEDEIQIIQTLCKRLGIPCITDAPFGHEEDNIALHLGRPIRITQENHSVSLNYTEEL